MLRSHVLLERSEERSILGAAVKAAREGLGGLVIVEGPAGIGKSQLLATGREEARSAGMLVLSARGTELERDFAFGVARQLFEPQLAEQQERNEFLAGAAGQALGVFSAGGATGVSPSEDVSFGLLHGLYWLTANVCAHQPVMLCIDDLQWCDVPSLRFLAFMEPRIEELPLIVVGAIRSGEPATDPQVLGQIATDQLTQSLPLTPLSAQSSRELVRSVFADAEDPFCSACFEASGGNPLWLWELLRVAADEGLPPTRASAVRLLSVAPRVIHRRVDLRLGRLGPVAAEVARAVSVLGEEDPALVAQLVALSTQELAAYADALVAAEILKPDPPLRFVHPLVQNAVYEGMSQVERQANHALAARLLTDADAAPEKVAGHLLRTLPAADPASVTMLRAAATEAVRRGAPATAVSYLQRCLAEPPASEHQTAIHAEMGRVAIHVNPEHAIAPLKTALDHTVGIEERAELGLALARALFFSGRYDEAFGVASRAIDELDGKHTDLQQLIEALVIPTIANVRLEPMQRRTVEDHIEVLRDVPTTTGIGGKSLDCALAFMDTLAVRNAAYVTQRARRGLSDGVIVDQALGGEGWLCGTFALMATDLDEALRHLDNSIELVHRGGSLLAVCLTLLQRGVTKMWRGDLTGAEQDLRSAMEAMAAGVEAYRPTFGNLAEVLLEQGKLDQATNVLKQIWAEPDVPQDGVWQYFLHARGRLLIAQGHVADGVEVLMQCGQRMTSLGWNNPAQLPWRSESALGLHMLSEPDKARELADQELGLARQWGEARPLGRALRVCGQITGGQQGLDLLAESVELLAPSPAELEYAKSLYEYGAALRRAGHRATARDFLTTSLDIAHRCDAPPLLAKIQTELRAAGGRPRRDSLTGPNSLTASERRVADLAATGLTNRDIAQRLFVTAKTVEVHLSNTFRKLGINKRTQLTSQLDSF